VHGTAKRTPGWTLHEGKGPRSWNYSVVFPEAFEQPPKIFLAVRLLDLVNKKETDFRFAAEARFIADASFTVTVSTWSDSRVWSVQVTWIAIDTRFSNQHGSMIHTGTEKFHKNDHGYSLDDGVGEREISRRLAFETRFAGVPQVFTGFSMIDATNGPSYDLRLHSSSGGVDEHGFDVALKTCVNAKVWSAIVSWIAIDPRLLSGVPQEQNYICASSVKASVHQNGYSLHRGEGARFIDRHVRIEPPYERPPQVAIFLNSFDILLGGDPVQSDDEEGEDAENPGTNLSYDARVVVSDQHRTDHGFDIRFETWNDSRVWEASATWITIGEPAAERPFLRPPPYREPEEYFENEHEEDEEDDDDDEEEEEEEFEEMIPEGGGEEEEEDFLPPRAQPAPKRVLSIPLIQPDGPLEAAPPAKKKKTAEEEDDRPAEVEADDSRECKVCMDALINTVLIPCGHVAICFDCAQMLRSKGNKDCPICKQVVTSIVKTFKV
jgi:hypothetical protein